MDDTRVHWDGVYSRRTVTEVSWFEAKADKSMALIDDAGLSLADPVIDVGAGASVLVGHLLQAGYRDVSALDVAADALTVSRDRLGADAHRVDWIVADLLSWRPARRYRLWHDRAVFHFLTDPAGRDRYRQVLRQALAPGGYLVVGTFAADGPTQCSGLPTARYGADELAAQFPGYTVLRAARDEHHTPAGDVQPFTWVLLGDCG
ncbi:Methyltransferase domain-containing protein [Micromonospora rhizosphaerae]|uniref:Methyltransferase domain-containing protein n=1 Tax=Micromonospora rhizosphaerae TaxID=568872 RepID=A0A1C6T1P2_9ACTN|nr:class I SAM-dependent methyltransferase [Micromonospora rhizosphaerae]SCL35730.1 Methyltransferase domain-containing protein [Micromonospora rhizosphaerae]